MMHRKKSIANKPVSRGIVIRSIGRIFCSGVDINESIDVKVFQKFIGWDVIMSGIKADIFRKKTIGISCEIIESKEEIFAVEYVANKIKEKIGADLLKLVPKKATTRKRCTLENERSIRFQLAKGKKQMAERDRNNRTIRKPIRDKTI